MHSPGETNNTLFSNLFLLSLGSMPIVVTKKCRFSTMSPRPSRAGATRKVPGRKGMSYTEEDWVDEDATSHREPDD